MSRRFYLAPRAASLCDNLDSGLSCYHIWSPSLYARWLFGWLVVITFSKQAGPESPLHTYTSTTTRPMRSMHIGAAKGEVYKTWEPHARVAV